MEREVKVSTAIGVFRARTTRDATALERDGQPYFAMNALAERNEQPDGALFEIQFGDGLWILARDTDLVAGVVRPAVDSATAPSS